VAGVVGMIINDIAPSSRAKRTKKLTVEGWMGHMITIINIASCGYFIRAVGIKHLNSF
jgi:hypothetical protein